MEALGARSRAWLAAQAELSESTLGDAISRGIAKADVAVKIARALGVTVDWLLVGGRQSEAPALVDAAQADFIDLPRYDLRNLTEGNKGDEVGRQPLRRDWLNRRLFTSVGLWLTELPSDYEALGLAEGDLVICSDLDDAGPQEKWVCIFRGAAGPFVARFSNIAGQGDIGLPELQDDIFPVARVHARLFAKV